jgi:hypothetical protein
MKDKFNQEINGELKKIVLHLINETLDEIELQEPTDQQRQILNEFSGKFGQKILAMQIILQGEPNGQKANRK